MRRFACLALALALPAQPPAERVETWPDGSVRERCALDGEGRPHGLFERFRADGTPELRGAFKAGQRHGQWAGFDALGRRVLVEVYRDGVLDGRVERFHENGRRAELTMWRRGVRHGPFEVHDADHWRSKVGHWRDGALHGELKITAGSKVLSRQQWDRGELAAWDGALRPFPIRQAELRAALDAILAAPASPAVDPADPKASERAAALRRLQAYRFLCRVPHEGMTLVAEWNECCDAAAEACRRNGELSHEPPFPEGMDPARYRLGVRGAGSSNIHRGGGMVQSVDSYMDDSDPSNIARIGHRRWCLNPLMRKTGFGRDGEFSAMWSFDASGRMPPGLDAVLYPPAGWVPAGFFGARHAWSIALVRGGTPRTDQLRIAVRRLDDDWLPAGDPLPLDWCQVAPEGYGTGACIVFRPVGIQATAGERYLVEVSLDGGKTHAFRYLIAFM